MKKSEHRILTTHAGSLPKTPALTAKHVAKAKGEALDEEAFASGVEEATREVISEQIKAGVDVINNGEVGRESFFTYLRHRMTGFGGESSRPIMADLTEYPGYLEQLTRVSGVSEGISLLNAPQAIAAVSYSSSEPIEQECAQLTRLLDAFTGQYEEAFVSAPSPGIVAAAMENAYYDSLEEYVQAVSQALTCEYKTIVDSGFILQIDAPDLAMERHTLFQDKSLAEFQTFLRLVINAINVALEDIPEDKVRLHVCWGNYEGAHDHDVPLEDIWNEIKQAKVGGYLLSMANPRHAHEYHLFENNFLPDDIVLVPGVIDTTSNYVEHPHVVADRLVQIANAVGDPTRIIAGTDCGFETSAGMVAVAPDIVWAKLKAMTEGAALASERLF